MAAAGSRWRRQVVVDVEVRRAGDVAGVVSLVAGRAGEREAGVDDDGLETVQVVDPEEKTGSDHGRQDPNGSGSGESATARARAAVSRRRWCCRHSTS